MTIFIRVLEAEDKAEALLSSIKDQQSTTRYLVNPRSFGQVPGSPFAYWVSNEVRDIFTHLPAFEAEERSVKQGLATADDFRFVRAWWEVTEAQIGSRWFDFAKGGTFSPFYADVHLLVNWEQSGREIRNNLNATGQIRSNVWMLKETANSYFFRPGLTWPLRTQKGLGLRAMPSGCIFGHKGPSAFVEGNNSNLLLYLLAITTSTPFSYLVELQMAFGSYEVGVIKRTPLPKFNNTFADELTVLTRRAWSLKRSLDTVNENSHAFILPEVIRSGSGEFDPVAIDQELATILHRINDITFHLYEIDDKDRKIIERWKIKGVENISDETDSIEDESGAVENAGTNDRDTLISWCIGVAFGRFDFRLVTGELVALSDQEPFTPQPKISPGMFSDRNRLFGTETEILVDDPGHSGDITTSVWNILERLDMTSNGELSTYRAWLAKEFFPIHIKMYSKSRRKAPVYWQLSTPSISYSVWLYVHALTTDTFYKVKNDYVEPKLAHAKSKLQSMREEFGLLPKANERKELAVQENFVEELRTFLEEVTRVVPLWKPNLDDGVVINFAPLWRLVPQHKSWQKELKATWDALCAGKYDWAHLSMNLWPERVVPKCAIDRSIAIAHCLESVFWVEGDDGQWKERTVPEHVINDLVYERTSSAVRAALESLRGASAISKTVRGNRTSASSKGGNK